MPSVRALARVTMTAAFHRMKARIRRARSSAPGNHGSSEAEMVFTYGVETVAGKSTWRLRARSSSFMRRNRARVRPCTSTTAPNESSHSAVSTGSMSGIWWEMPSKSMAPCSHPRAASGTKVPNGPPEGFRVVHMSGGRPRPTRRGVHGRLVPREPRAGRMGVGGARRALCDGRRGPHHQPAHGDHGGARGPPLHRRGRWSGPDPGDQRLDVRRQVLPGPMVGGVAAPRLAKLPAPTGGEPGPVGTPPRPGARVGPRGRVPVGEGPQRRPLERLRGRARRRRGHRGTRIVLSQVLGSGGLRWLGRTIGPMELNNSSAIVTGGASGLGAATARALSERGARVVIFDRNEDGAKQVAGEVGGEYVGGDVTNPDDCQKAVDQAAGGGALRVAVNCAGTGWAGRVINRGGPRQAPRSFEFILRLNVIGTFNVMTRAAAAIAKTEPTEDGERGVIVNTASSAAFDGQIGQLAYSASRGAVVGMTDRKSTRLNSS